MSQDDKKISIVPVFLSYHRPANWKKLILPLEKYFKAMKDMIIATETTKLFEPSTINKVGKIMASKYKHSMLPGAFPDKVTPEINFVDKVVFWCDISVLKTLLQVMVIYKWS